MTLYLVPHQPQTNSILIWVDWWDALPFNSRLRPSPRDLPVDDWTFYFVLNKNRKQLSKRDAPAPAVCSTGTDLIDVFARGSDDACWYRRFDPAQGDWQGWESLGGELVSDPAAVAVGDVRYVVVRGADGFFYWRWYRGPDNQSPWQRFDAPPSA